MRKEILRQQEALCTIFMIRFNNEISRITQS